MRERMRSNLVDTQTKVSVKGGIAQSTVQRILSLEQSATLDVLESLAVAFGIKKSEYLLLELEEVKLLSLWASLTKQDQVTVLGFIQMKTEMKPAQAEQLQFDSHSDVPSDMAAASMRASGRLPAGEQTSNADDNTKASNRRKA